MPYRVRQQDCKQSDGSNGSWVVQKKEDGSWVKDSCHTSKRDANGAMTAKRIAEQEDD